MPTFATPEPITVDLSISSGRVVILASAREETVVQVKTAGGVDPADLVRVEYANGTLAVKTSALSGPGRVTGKDGSADVTIELPTGSGLQAQISTAEIRAEGSLGECQLHSSAGSIQLDRTGTLHSDMADGDLTVGHVTGFAAVSGASGKVRLGEIHGNAVVKTANGEIWIGSATGDLTLSTANGNIAIERAEANVTVKTSGGTIRVSQLTRGKAELMTAAGDVEIGISEGSAAWVDAQSKLGSVDTSLPAQDKPEQFAETVEVRARTQSGDIRIGRAAQTSASSPR
jgi:DUF4097 and DUF4098 domain-containing protein YvlB